jgi:hypothetical protein
MFFQLLLVATAVLTNFNINAYAISRVDSDIKCGLLHYPHEVGCRSCENICGLQYIQDTPAGQVSMECFAECPVYFRLMDLKNYITNIIQDFRVIGNKLSKKYENQMSNDTKTIDNMKLIWDLREKSEEILANLVNIQNLKNKNRSMRKIQSNIKYIRQNGLALRTQIKSLISETNQKIQMFRIKFMEFKRNFDNVLANINLDSPEPNYYLTSPSS